MEEADKVLIAVIQRELEDGRTFLAAKGFDAPPSTMVGPSDVGAWTLTLSVPHIQGSEISGEILIEIDPARVGWHVEATASVYPSGADRGNDVDIGRVRITEPTDPDYWARVLVRRSYVTLWQDLSARPGDIAAR